jgi:thioredoxin 2
VGEPRGSDAATARFAPEAAGNHEDDPAGASEDERDGRERRGALRQLRDQETGSRPRREESLACGRCKAALPWVADATDESFDAVVVKAPLPVLVDLWAPWCGPCRTVSPALEDIARDLAGSVKLVKVDVDVAPAVSQRFGVQGIPMLVVTDRGKVVDTRVGAAPKAELRSWLERALASVGRAAPGSPSVGDT